MAISKSAVAIGVVVIGAFVGGSYLTSHSAKASPQEPGHNATSSLARLPTAHQAFQVGDWAPAMTIRVAYPIVSAGAQVQIGSGRFANDNSNTTVVAIWTSTPKCACGPARTALVKARAKTYATPITWIAANAVEGSGAEAATEQMGLDMQMQSIAIGTEYGSSSLATKWADDIAPTVIVIDHDRRVRYIARGKDASNVKMLENAIVNSTLHAARERQG